MFRANLPLSRWQTSALLFCAGSLVSFIGNLSFTIWATTRAGSNIQDGVGVLSEAASCDKVKNMNTGIHVMINILSTVLLAGSNYCMQSLSAPTRTQIDEAHRQTRWVDVGVPSIRNLCYAVSGGNVVLWVLLSLSSLPLHLFYNSAIFTSISANDYAITITNEGVMALQNLTDLPPLYPDPVDSRLAIMHRAAHSGLLERLDRNVCLDAYATNFQSARGDLLLVQSGSSIPTTPPPDEELYEDAHYILNCILAQSYSWACSHDFYSYNYFDPCVNPCEDRISSIKDDPDNWRPFGIEVKECYSLPTEQRCKLMFSPVLCWVVTALNLLKAVLMMVTAVRRDRKPILTVGDAVASFMTVPDCRTADMCLVSKQDIVKTSGFWQSAPRMVGHGRRSKFAAASRTRWWTCIFLYLLALAFCIGLYIYGGIDTKGTKDFGTLMGLGLGTLNSKTLIQSEAQGQDWSSLLANVVIANSPQVILSMLYFTYNGLFTSIALATEWDSYARHRKGLRVSSPPVGAQRTTYFLQLPYRYSLPLLVISGLLHWLLSQSIFLVFVEIYRDSVSERASSGAATSGPDTAEYNYITCGWSPAGVFSVIIVGVFMVAFLLASGFRRLRGSGSGMPVAASCSAAISAACHAVPYNEMAWEKPLQWGVASVEEGDKGHCSFSSEWVDVPKQGVMYS